mmetsp:Transcript_18163/g.32230  ORF Transcript_18163/g.32230 Transcript_18163/m.32230 type:complete len:122 (+) Transcript_18163:133-498(+)
MEALRMELRGFGGAVAVRYASWPIGASVEVSLLTDPGDPQTAGSQGKSVLTARLVHYDAASNNFEVRLRDGSTRIVPAQRVRRVSQTPGGATRGPTSSPGVGNAGAPSNRRSRARSPELLR